MDSDSIDAAARLYVSALLSGDDAYIRARHEQLVDLVANTLDAAQIESCYRAAATEKWVVDERVQIDPDATVSISSDEGAYVAAWVWIDDRDVEFSGLISPRGVPETDPAITEGTSFERAFGDRADAGQ